MKSKQTVTVNTKRRVAARSVDVQRLGRALRAAAEAQEDLAKAYRKYKWHLTAERADDEACEYRRRLQELERPTGADKLRGELP